jgi:dihydropteroate synthase
MGSLHFGGRELVRGRSPLLMGVLNVTPDSFSDGGRYLDRDAAVRHAVQLVEAGADLLDVGGESSRPGSLPVALEEELQRVVPVLRELRPRVEVPISIDTTKAEVARQALDWGVDLVNDISGLRFDPRMLPTLAGSNCGVVLMHMQGEPRTMQEAPSYDDVVGMVRAWFEMRLAEIAAGGITPERVILDPGIGFGKRFADNVALLGALDRLRVGGRPLLIGASRKAFLGWLLEEPEPARRLEGDLAVAAHCRAAGVEVLRVHDVVSLQRFLRVLDALDEGAPGEASLDGAPPTRQS